jgi:glycosyltransferase involved in cell wall biosynthesis
MIVNYIFRTKLLGSNSIEEVFSGIHYNINKPYFSNKYFWKDCIVYRFTKGLFKDQVYHITGGINYVALFLPFTKKILTIHDIGHYKNLTGLRKLIFGIFWFRIPIILCNHITSVSEFTKNDVLQHFGKKYEQKISVVPNPVPPIFENLVISTIKKDRIKNIKKILQIGTQKNKNLITVIKSLSHSDYHLTIIGNLDLDELKLLQDLNILYTNLTDLSYEQVKEEYLKCDLVLFVSHHEGFGMPIIEAQASRKPVICTKITSIPEVANGSVIYIENPNDSRELKSVIDRILNNEDLYNLMIDLGIKNIERFSSKNVIDKYFDIYKRL